jgi:hypothetical protein
VMPGAVSACGASAAQTMGIAHSAAKKRNGAAIS